MKKYSIKEIAVLMVFIFGIVFYIMAIVIMPSEFSFDAIKDVHSAFSAALMGTACIGTAIIGAIRITKWNIYSKYTYIIVWNCNR